MESPTDAFVFAIMLVLTPIFLVILLVALVLSAPVWVPIELAMRRRRHG